MIKEFKRFLSDETGAVTIDSVIVMGGSVWMAAAVVGDISVATMGVTDKINERLEYASIVADIMGDFGPGGAQDTNSNNSSGSGGGSDDCVGNPGNNKCVGNAGENPNGKGGWGSGSRGRSR